MRDKDPLPVTRFAPSPTGRLHIGHAYAAACVFETAKRRGGKALLRIENIDHTRCHPELTEGIYDDLTWLGFEWLLPVRMQNQHYNAYAKVVIDLIERGLAYPCTLTRTQLKASIRTPRPASLAHGEAARICEKIRGAARFKTPSLPFAIRLNLKAALKQTAVPLTYREGDITQTARPSLDNWAASDRPDPIIARRDIGTSYHIAVTHDDQLQGITDIVRGADFIDQTPLHVLLQYLMDWRTPVYHHHTLLTDDDGRKLSKTAKDQTIQSLRESGMSAADVLSKARSAL